MKLIRESIISSRTNKKPKKKLENDSDKLRKDYKGVIENLNKVRSKYVQLSKDADSSEATHSKGKGDVNMKPSALAKLAAKASQAADKAAAADKEYQSVLSATNQKQNEYYTNTMPTLLKDFQQFEVERLEFMKDLMTKFATLNAQTSPAYSSYTETITSASSSISIPGDIQAFSKENKTGVTVPADIQYVPYDKEAPSTGGPKPKVPVKVPTKKKGAIGNYKPAADVDILNSKKWGLLPMDQNTSIESQQAKLHEQLQELDKAFNSETTAKAGLENLIKFYNNDPVAQKSAEGQLVASEQKLSKLAEVKNIVQGQLEQLGGGGYDYSNSGARVRGLYDYTATCDTELSFFEGDILTVTEQDESGWWFAELNGKSGFIPNNYVQQM